MRRSNSSFGQQETVYQISKPNSMQEINSSICLSQGYQQNSSLNQLYANRFLGEWNEDKYTVTRKYVPTYTNGLNLYTTYCTPQNPFASIVIIHGYGDHSGRYFHVADEYAKSGFQVILYDQRGFGNSGGIRSHGHIKQMHQDLECILLTIERSLPIFLQCQSLGAAVGLSFCISNPTLILQGVIVVNPYLQFAQKYGLLKKTLLTLMNKIIPGLMVNSYIDFGHCSKNNNVIKTVAEDSLVQPFMSIGMAYNILQLEQYILPNVQQFVQPLLILHGKEDKVASHMNSVELYRLAGSKDKTLKLFDKGFHELQNDIEFERVKNIITIWCQKQINKDKRISYFRELNHGLVSKYNHNSTKMIIFQWILIYFMLRNKMKNLGRIARFICILALMIASLIVHIRW
ncbi:unnamed protein product [Paramecium pentaurelia]|uniref:Serine aminopeptidase S33 domain-containing protein n=1 Tax=Paramecium pentaurelia TaxID=43138 RepID=A0A8S1TD70_9CILI|nr:unnamed protein product [Paramecium pentaurelia]